MTIHNSRSKVTTEQPLKGIDAGDCRRLQKRIVSGAIFQRLIKLKNRINDRADKVVGQC